MKLQDPYPFQIEGANWLASMPEAFLADDMGLGKSCQAIRGADIIGADRILVVCPANVRPNWVREFGQFSPLDRPIKILESASDPIPAEGVVIVSYDLLVAPSPNKSIFASEDDPGNKKKADRAAWALKHEKERKVFLVKLKAISWDLVILDEAHYLKERTSDRTRAIYGRGAKTPGLTYAANYVWRLSGTPAPNDASELWPHLFYAHVISESYWDFTFRHCTGFESERGFKITGHKNVSELKARLSRFMLRRTKDQVMSQLPKLRFQEVEVEASEVDMKDFEDVREGKTRGQFKGEMDAAEKALQAAMASMDPLKVLTTEQQNQGTLRRYTVMRKLPAILDILSDELRRDHKLKLVVFGIHRCAITKATERLAEFGAVSLFGGTPPTQRQRNLERFQSDDQCRVFVGNITAAGTGIDGLQKASCEVCFLEQDWVPASNAQAVMRVHRNLQTRPVRARIFTLANSTDQEVQAALLRKVKELAKVF